MKTMGRLWRVYSSHNGREAEEDIISLFFSLGISSVIFHEN
jgi:hypothetical protein